MAEYRAHYSHDGRNWIVHFTDPDVSTYGRTLAQAKRYAREALAVWLDLSSVDELDPRGARVLLEVFSHPAALGRVSPAITPGAPTRCPYGRRPQPRGPVRGPGRDGTDRRRCRPHPASNPCPAAAVDPRCGVRRSARRRACHHRERD